MDKEISNIFVADSNKKVNTFWASGYSIRGINKKGKEFFKFDTNHTEDIKHLFVDGSNLWSVGDYILNSYKGSKQGIEDNFYYLSDDKIYDMIVANVSGNLIFNSILAWDDSSVRVLVDSDIYYSQSFNSPVLALHNASNLSMSTTPHIAYGLKNGSFGMIDMQRDAPLILWDVNDMHSSEAPINIVFWGKFVDSAEDNDVVIAREDGSCEIYSFSDTEQPYLKYVLNFQESIVGVGMGHISKANFKEIMVSLFSGKVAGLIDSSSIDEEPEDNTAIERRKKIEQLEEEKKSLMKKRAKKKAKMEPTAASIGIVGFKCNSNFSILPKEAAYSLILETQVSIQVILLQSTIGIDLLDIEKIPGQVCFSQPDPQDKTNQFLVTIKLSESWSRVVLKLRASEGLNGSLNWYIIPTEESSKVWKRIEIPILPLSLHEKVSGVPNKDELELSSITLTGNFSQNDILNWIAKWMPDVPKFLESNDTILYFRSTFIGTFLIISIGGDGTCTISSNNLSALTILKGQIMTEASLKSRKIDTTASIVDESIEVNLSLIHPKLEEQYKLAKNVQLIDGLKELQMQEEDLKFLSDEYKEILASADKIKNEFKNQPRKLNFLWGIIADLYNDTAVIKGIHDVSSKIPKLKQILNNYDFDELVHFFKTSI